MNIPAAMSSITTHFVLEASEMYVLIAAAVVLAALGLVFLLLLNGRFFQIFGG